MTQPKYKVTYVSNTCGDKDELQNHPHDSVANSLYALLKNHREIKHPVIGLEGSWGSGKSQVINILRKIIKNNNEEQKFCFITYDIWGAQEDLTRRSFLDSILSSSKENDEFFETKLLKEDYDKLNATSVIHKTRTFPTIRLFFVWLLLIPIALFFINAVEQLFGYYREVAWSYNQLKGCVSLVLALFSFIAFCFSYFDELSAVNSDDKKKKIKYWEKFKIVIGRIFYVLKEKDIEKEDYETIITDEPSVSRFQNIFDHIKSTIKSDKTLIIVFDNMDRLSDSSKLMSTWSLLHTFFAEKDYGGKIWAIVPFAKQQLIELMTSDGKSNPDKTTDFINKTFFTSFRIPEPIMGSWKSFLNKKLDEAFDPSIDTEDKTIVALIFSRSMTEKQIRPRDIIAYVNKLVTLYSQHYFEEIPIKNLALYAQYEHEFDKPLDAILKFNGFESFVPLFESRTKLSGWLSSIYYNLPSTEALEVAFERSITAFLQNDYEIIGGTNEMENAYIELSSHSVFKNYIEEYFNKEADYANLKMENVFYLLNKREITHSTRQKIYVNIADQIDTLKDQFYIYEPWMEYAFLNCSDQNTNTIIAALLKEARQDFESYYQTVVELLKIKDKRNIIKVQIDSFKSELVPDMVAFAKYLKENDVEKYYTKTKISIENSKLLEYMKEGATRTDLFSSNAEMVYDLLRLFRAHNVNLVEIADEINNAGIQVTNLTVEQVERIYRVFNIVNSQIKLVPSYTIVNNSAALFMVVPEYLACAIYKLVSLKAAVSTINSVLTGELNEKTKPVCKYITKYVSIDDLLKLAVDSDNALLQQLSQLLISDYTTTITTSGYLLEHTSAVIEQVLAPCEDKLILLLDDNADHVLHSYGLDCLGVDKYWFEKIDKDSIEKHLFFSKICENWIKGLNEYTKDDWNSIFQKENENLTTYILKLERENLLPIGFWNKADIESSVKESFLGYIESKNDIDEVLLDVWMKHSSESVKATLANYISDSIGTPSLIGIIELYSFVHLYIKNSKRLQEKKYADTFFDDFFSRFIQETSIDSLLQFVLDNWEKIYEYCLLISNDRQERLITLMSQRKNDIPKDLVGLPKWENCIDAFQVKVDKEQKIKLVM